MKDYIQFTIAIILLPVALSSFILMCIWMALEDGCTWARSLSKWLNTENKK